MICPFKRKEVIGDCTLYLGDCYQITPHLGKFDALVTDPPYSFLTTGAGIFRSNRKNMDQIKANHLDKGFDYSLFSSKQFGAVVTFAHNDQWAELLPYLASQFDRYVICQWHKTNAMPVANKHYRPDTEIYVHAWNKDYYPIGKLQTKQRYITTLNGKDTGINHPTVKPLAVMEKIINNTHGTSVLDPFMGSGSTGVACIYAHRKFVGIEINEDFFEIACQRIAVAYAQPDMINNLKVAG